MIDVERILVMAPHTDDGEFGCGGLLARVSLEETKKVSYVAFSCAEKSLPPDISKDMLQKEAKKATAILGINEEDLYLLNYPVRDFPEYRQEILDEMIRLEKEIKPELVLLPSLDDTHQDHRVIAEEGFRAFKRTTMLGYEIPWNMMSFRTDCFVFLEKVHVDLKLQALGCYMSQLGRNYVNEEFIRSIARTRGGQIGTEYAEAFNVVRWVWR